MIRFCCEQCGHKISVQDEHAGRRCKCQQCDSVIVVPQRSTVVDFNCENCGRKISVPQVHACKKGKCPECGHLVVVPEQTELEAPAHERKEDVVDGLSLEERQALGGEMPASKNGQSGQRKFPWSLDIFLYPTSASGLVHVAVFLIVPIVIDLFGRYVFVHFGRFGLLLSGLLYIFLIMYWFSYLCECIRDSAGGGLRAPDPVGGVSGRDEIIEQCITWIACYAFFFGPVTFYRGYTYMCGTQMNNAIFWPLLAYGVFFFPMGILAVVVFDSVNALNPILLIGSIASTFLQYCGLAAFFAGFCFLRIQVLTLSIKQRWGILARVLPDIVLIWLLFVAVHLIGRFYWRYQEKLNWEA